MKFLNDYYQKTIGHRNIHKCGGYPFENGEFLFEIAKTLKPEYILEIGTSIGYSATCLAMGTTDSSILTIDIDQTHFEIASGFWQDYNVSHQISMEITSAETYLKTTKKEFDLIFYDAFAPDPTLTPLFKKVATQNTLIISTNLELPSKIMTGDEYLTQLDRLGFYTFRVHDNSFSSKLQSTAEKAFNLWERSHSVSKNTKIQ